MDSSTRDALASWALVVRVGLVGSLGCLLASACAETTPPSRAPGDGPASSGAGSGPAGDGSTNESAACNGAGGVRVHDLNATGSTEALIPCAKGGAEDLSGLIKVETIPEGVHITIRATDDEVNLGALGADVKTRDAVIVYPRGAGEKAVEVPLVRTKDGYVGDKIVMWDDLDKLNDEGTKLDIAVYDHDATGAEASEEMHVSFVVSTGKSCEKAQAENPQSMDLAKGGAAPKANLSDGQLGAPLKTSEWFSSCGLPDSAKAEICVAVKGGKPLGVSVGVTPQNQRVAACIDRSARRLRFPESDQLDVVHERY